MSSVGDKKIPNSRSTKEYLSYVVDFVLRAVLTFNLVKKLVIYFIIVTCLSIFGDIQRPGPSYFSRKNNVLNQYFVKLGWGWTMTGVIALMLITNLIQHKGEIRNMTYPILRLTLLTLYWYVCTHSFEWLENYTGTCSNPSLVTKRPCMKAGFGWLGFDISGHCYLLTFSLTVINEECQLLHKTSKMVDSIERNEEERLKCQTLISSSTYRTFLRLAMFLLTFLTFLWEIMLIATSLYFHTTAQKVLGMVVAVAGWFVIYKVLRFNKDLK